MSRTTSGRGQALRCDHISTRYKCNLDSVTTFLRGKKKNPTCIFKSNLTLPLPASLRCPAKHTNSSRDAICPHIFCFPSPFSLTNLHIDFRLQCRQDQDNVNTRFIPDVNAKDWLGRHYPDNVPRYMLIPGVNGAMI